MLIRHGSSLRLHSLKLSHCIILSVSPPHSFYLSHFSLSSASVSSLFITLFLSHLSPCFCLFSHIWLSLFLSVSPLSLCLFHSPYLISVLSLFLAVFPFSYCLTSFCLLNLSASLTSFFVSLHVLFILWLSSYFSLSLSPYWVWTCSCIPLSLFLFITFFFVLFYFFVSHFLSPSLFLHIYTSHFLTRPSAVHLGSHFLSLSSCFILLSLSSSYCFRSCSLFLCVRIINSLSPPSQFFVFVSLYVSIILFCPLALVFSLLFMFGRLRLFTQTVITSHTHAHTDLSLCLSPHCSLSLSRCDYLI